MAERMIRITAGGVSAQAVLNRSQAADDIWDALPITGSANTWGDEIYFSIPVKMPMAADAKEVVEMGDLAYWPPGTAFCIFFGLTPASSGDEIRPASAVNVFGRVQGDPAVFKAVPAGETVSVDKA